MTLSLNFGSHTYALSEACNRPFVPSMAPEDLRFAEEIGILTPKSFRSDLDALAPPFVPKPRTWSNIHEKDTAENNLKAHTNLINDIQFLECAADFDQHEEILEEASEWLTEQQNILWAPEYLSGDPLCHIKADCAAISIAETLPSKTLQDVKILKVFPTHSFGSINGLACVYLPWGSDTRRDGPPGIKQTFTKRFPLIVGEIVLAELAFHKQGRNSWRATAISNKLPTEQMLEGVVEITTNFSKEPTFTGSQFSFIVPCNTENIGSVIGTNGNNLNNIIQGIQKRAENNTHKLPEEYAGKFELPELTITPIDNSLEYNSFTPTKAYVRVFVPVCCIWDYPKILTLVSYFHS